MKFTITAVPSLTAVIALAFTYMSVQQTRVQSLTQNQIAESGQISDRFSTAIGDLGSSVEDVRQGGIYALQRIMQDSGRDQPAIMQIIASFLRDHTANARAHTSFGESENTPSDVQDAAQVLAMRDSAYDAGVRLNLERIDIPHTDLPDAAMGTALLWNANLGYANLVDADFHRADLTGVFLGKSDLVDANFAGATMIDANLAGAGVDGANFAGALLRDANLSDTDITETQLRNADLGGACLYRTALCQNGKPTEPERGYSCTPPPWTVCV